MRTHCSRGHKLTEADVYADGSCKKCSSIKRAYRTRQDALKRQQATERSPEYVPALRLYRERCGFSARDVAAQACIKEGSYMLIEDCNIEATYAERLAICQALTFLRMQQEEEAEREREKRQRLRMAGLAL